MAKRIRIDALFYPAETVRASRTLTKEIMSYTRSFRQEYQKRRNTYKRDCG
ncbi:MAG: hypothetical protein GX217_04885 [Clostridiaceae bacterium]|nr:hypothetical protein [Clostridiaceae bacterium]